MRDERPPVSRAWIWSYSPWSSSRGGLASRKIRANLARHRPLDGMRMMSVDDGYVCSGFTGSFGGAQLGTHSASAELALAVAEFFHCCRQPANRAQEFRSLAAIRHIKAIHIGQQQQPVCLDGGGK